MKRNDPNLLEWLKSLNEVGVPSTGGPAEQPAGGPPMNQPGSGLDPLGNGMEQPAPDGGDVQASTPDVSQDPSAPEMPEEQGEEDDFEIWRQKYVDESVKGDPNKLLEMIQAMQNRELESGAFKFISDNMNVCFIRQNPMVFQPSQELRKLLKQDIDRNLPSTSIIKHLSTVLDKSPLLSDIFIKLVGTLGGKQDLHRKYMAGLLGAVQVGSGSVNEDILFQESEYSIPISTRFNSTWGEVVLGPWDLTEDDPNRFLKEPEQDRLQGGSPEERDVLRRRVVLESIANMFKQRAFLITVVQTDGTIHHLGLDLGNCLSAGFLDGRIIVRSEDSDTRRAFISDEGDIVSIPELTIYYVRETEGGMDRQTEEIEFMRHREGQLFLSAQADLLVEASSTLQGVLFKEVPWRGNPTDFVRLARTTPAADEILFRRSDI